MPGAHDQVTPSEDPDEPDQDREDRSTRKRLATRLVEATGLVVINTIGQVFGDALSTLIHLKP